MAMCSSGVGEVVDDSFVGEGGNKFAPSCGTWDFCITEPDRSTHAR